MHSIRTSERRFYQQKTDIFAECSIDYDPNSEITHNFYATVQNKFHYAITKQTAAEIIYHKADKAEPFMGLSTWKNAPSGRVLPSDVTIAKNCMEVHASNENDFPALNQIFLKANSYYHETVHTFGQIFLQYMLTKMN